MKKSLVIPCILLLIAITQAQTSPEKERICSLSTRYYQQPSGVLVEAKGKGVFLDPELILTASHVVPHTEVLVNGKLKGRVVARALRGYDLALVVLENETKKQLPFLELAQEISKEKLYFYSDTETANRRVKETGSVEETYGYLNSEGSSVIIQTLPVHAVLSFKSDAGDSGSPVFTDTGKLAGIMFGHLEKDSRAVIATPAAIRSFLQAVLPSVQARLASRIAAHIQ